jgi:hypothetical protein
MLEHFFVLSAFQRFFCLQALRQGAMVVWHFREECEEYVEGVWAWLEGLGTGISRDDPSTWTAPEWVRNYKGIINSLEVAHQDFVWRVRKHPRVLQVCLLARDSSRLLGSTVI